MATNALHLESDSELSDTASNVSLIMEPVEVEFEQGESNESDNSDPEIPYMDETIADEEWLGGYNKELEEADRRSQMLTNRLDGAKALETWCVDPRFVMFISFSASMQGLHGIIFFSFLTRYVYMRQKSSEAKCSEQTIEFRLAFHVGCVIFINLTHFCTLLFASGRVSL